MCNNLSSFIHVFFRIVHQERCLLVSQLPAAKNLVLEFLYPRYENLRPLFPAVVLACADLGIQCGLTNKRKHDVF